MPIDLPSQKVIQRSYIPFLPLEQNSIYEVSWYHRKWRSAALRKLGTEFMGKFDDRIAQLRKKLVFDKVLYDVWDYFLTNLIETPGFIDLGEATTPDKLITVMSSAAGQILKTDIVHVLMIYVQLKEQKFIHGTGTINGKMAGVIYFEDISQGILYILMDKVGNNQFARFRVEPFVQPRDPSRN